MDYTTPRSIQQPVELSLERLQNMTLEEIQAYDTTTIEIKADGVDIPHTNGNKSDEDQFESSGSEAEAVDGYPGPNSHADDAAREVQRLRIQVKERDLKIKVFQHMQQKYAESPEVVEASSSNDAGPPLSISGRSASTHGTKFTRSSAQLSQYGSAWPQSLDRTMNSGFGAGAPRQKEFRRVREGRERGVGLPGIFSIGRTGKAPAPVPPSMLTALAVQRTNLDSEREKESMSDLVEVDKEYEEARGGEEAAVLSIEDAIMMIAYHEDQLKSLRTAEPFSIVAGDVGIAIAFSSCVECFEYIQFDRHFGRDLETNQLILDCARLRLTRWGESVNIYNDSKFGYLDPNSTEVRIANNTLLQILVLFENTAKMSTQYKLKAKAGNDISVFSSDNMDPSFRCLSNKMRELAIKRQKRHSRLKMTTLALYHSSEFKQLIENITILTEQLETFFPASSAQLVELVA